jgi:hypothetical protein
MRIQVHRALGVTGPGCAAKHTPRMLGNAYAPGPPDWTAA